MIDIHHRLIASTNKTGDALKNQITRALTKLKSGEIQNLKQHGFNKQLIDQITWVDETSPVMENQPPAPQVIHINPPPGGFSPSMPPAQSAEDSKYKEHFEKMKILVIQQVAAQVVAQILDKEQRKLTDSDWQKYPLLMITPALPTAVAHVKRDPYYGAHYDEYHIQPEDVIKMVREHGNKLASIKLHESAMYKHMSSMLVNNGFQLAEACMIAHQVVYEGEDVNTAITKLKKKKK